MNPRSSCSSPPYLLRRPLLLATLLYCLGLVVANHFGALGFPPGPGACPQREGFCRLTGIVIGTPQVQPGKIAFPVEGEGRVTGLRFRVIVRGLSQLPLVGDRLQLRGYFELPRLPSNPGEFDYGRYLWGHHLVATLTVRGGSFADTGDSHRLPIRRLANAMARGIVNSLDRCLAPEEAAVFGGLVLGEKPRAFPQLQEAFQSSGTIHVLVASGFKVAFVVGCWMLIARWGLRLPLNISLAGSIPWAVLYSFVVGGEPPVVRSSIMATVGILGYLLAREDRAYHSLGLAALGLLVWDPRTLFDLSFQMSFVAVFGLIHYAPMLVQLNKFRHHSLLQLFATSLTAQLWFLPILAVSFHRVPLWAPFSNLIAIPLSAVALPAGFALALLDQLATGSHWPVWGWGRKFIAAACSLIAKALIWTAKKFAVALWCPVPSAGWIIAFYLVLLFMPGIRRSLLCRWVAGLGTAALILWPGHASKPGITWLDVGTGSAVVVHGGDGETVLIAGSIRVRKGFDVGERIILPYLADCGVKRLSALFLLDPDSVESVRSVLKTLPVERFFPVSLSGWSGRFGSARIECLSRSPVIMKVDFGDESIFLDDAGKKLGVDNGRIDVLQWSGNLFDLDSCWLREIHPSGIVISSKNRLPSFYYGVPVFCTVSRGAVFYEGRARALTSMASGD